MRRLFLTAILALTATALMAVPARRGLWQNVQLAGGGTARVQLVGDEHMHFYIDEHGTRYTADSQTGLYAPIGDTQTAAMQRRAAARRQQIGSRSPLHRIGKPDQSIYQGTKKALVILAAFSNKSFKAANNLDLYKDIINTVGYENGRFKGSVRDYFRAQSNGAFDIDFDVVGVCPLSRTVSYYGANDSNGDDKRPGEMIAEACLWAHDNGVDFSKYDWNGDGAVDQVFVVYAGLGEADGGSASTIWPHMYYLSESDYGKALQLDGVTVDTYACGPELQFGGIIAGIGTFCHEFSHCMGFPDLYDTSYAGWYGMGYYDLMGGGSYNGDGFIPAGYSAAEKSDCGWLTLKDMTGIAEPTAIDDMLPMTQNGDAYIIKNKGNEDEYYILEYRRKEGWDAELPREGIMVTHIDYDKYVWEWNCPNTNTQYQQGNSVLTNTHMRWTIFHANNGDTDAGALYPYGSNDSLTRTSVPAAMLYTANTANADRSRFMHIKIKDMAVADDKSHASLTLEPYRDDTPVTPPAGDGTFYESFDGNNGTGGNDGQWSGSIAVSTVTSDNAGWTSDNGKIYGADRCIRLGSSKDAGTVTSPEFAANGTVTVTFKAAAWDNSRDGTTLTLTASGGTLGQTTFSMARGAWTEYSTTLTASGSATLTFATSAGRFFLDEVRVAPDATGIGAPQHTAGQTAVTGYYALDGTRLQAPRKGVCIVRYADGTSRKVVVM